MSTFSIVVVVITVVTTVSALPRRLRPLEVEVVLEHHLQLPWTHGSAFGESDERNGIRRGPLFVDDFVPDDFNFYPKSEPLIAYQTAAVRRFARSVNDDDDDSSSSSSSSFGRLLRRLADQTSSWLMTDGGSEVREAQMRLARDVDSNSKVLESNSSSDSSLTLDVLREKIEQLANKPQFDRELLRSLNETLHDASISTDNAKVIKLFLRLVEEFEQAERRAIVQADTNSTNTSNNDDYNNNDDNDNDDNDDNESNEDDAEVVGLKENDADTEVDTTNETDNDDSEAEDGQDVEGGQGEEADDALCHRLDKLKVMPGDDLHTVHHKQAKLMRCYMNEKHDPCDDFYEYACGRWEDFQPLPKDRGSYDVFEILREDLSTNLMKLFEARSQALENESRPTAAVKLLFDSCMDMEKIGERGEQPLLRLLRDELGGWPVLLEDSEASLVSSRFSWLEAIRTLRMYNNDILVAVWVGPDGKDSKKFILQFDQSDLLLPSAEYYKLGLGHPILRTYKNLLVDVARMLGSVADDDRIEKEMTDVLEFETRLASIMMPPHERRNFSEIYAKLSLAELQRLLPGFDLTSFLAPPLLPRDLNASEPVVVYALPYLQKLIEVLESSDQRTLANYIIWRFVRHRINNLDARFQHVQNALYRTLFGREETPPRWKFCVSYVNGNLGNAVGAMFVNKHFDEQSKRDMEALTNEVQGVFRELVEEADWLSNSTKHLATEKIAAIIHNIGYPDYILDEQKLIDEIEGIEYRSDEFFENVLKNLQTRTQREMSQLDKSVNRSLWTATPAVVNAYYSRNRNQIMFPAGILQPPFYHKHFPKALNYGGIGIVIGHELTHGFDDKGRQFDHQGNIKQWWDHVSSSRFKQRKQCIIDQYGNYVVDEVNIRINGANTQGENIADNGGIKQAFEAYERWLEASNLLDERMSQLAHLSGQQLFFLNFAQVWCGSTRPEALRSKLRTAVHAPGKYRVLGSLSNLEAFSRAYDCPIGSNMNPQKKCSVW